jgi:hypothetical protein
MAIDTKYGPEVAQVVNIMTNKPEGVVLRYPEIEQIIGLPVTNPLFHKILSSAIRKLAERRIPVRKERNQRRISLPGGIVRISPGDKVQHGYDRITRGLNRVANNGFTDVNTVDVTTLSEEDQITVLAVNTTAKMAQLMATENTQDLLKGEIRIDGNRLIDAKSTFAKLFERNL